MNRSKRKQIKVPLTVEQKIRRRTIRAFATFFVLLVAGLFLFMRLYHQRSDDGVQASLRGGLKLNEKIFSSAYSKDNVSKEYPVSKAEKTVRVNGDAGMGSDFDAAAWRLKVARGPGDTLFLTLDELKALPKTEVIFDFKCIEGWDQVTHWAGVRFSDFVSAYHLDKQATTSYVGLVTPDKEYYVGIDMPGMMQRQTILCYEMNGKPLPVNQGYPLRLIIPVKYGIKHLKRIGTLYFSNNKPPDYWAERGYDYYAGL